MLKRLVLITFIALTGLILSACSGPVTATEVRNTPTESASLSTSTPVQLTLNPTNTSFPTETATPTITLIPSPTEVPFKGFLKDFSLYRAWNDGETTSFYFLQADFPGTLYARADEYDLVCNPDPEYPIHTVCLSDQKIFGKDLMTFTFFTDAARSNLVYTQEFNTGLVNDIIFHHNTDCPLRGQNVTCESEYRLYDGRCYYSHTCYDDCGLYYSQDNLPDVWTEFQGYTDPCN